MECLIDAGNLFQREGHVESELLLLGVEHERDLVRRLDHLGQFLAPELVLDQEGVGLEGFPVGMLQIREQVGQGCLGIRILSGGVQRQEQQKRSGKRLQEGA